MRRRLGCSIKTRTHAWKVVGKCAHVYAREFAQKPANPSQEKLSASVLVDEARL